MIPSTECKSVLLLVLIMHAKLCLPHGLCVTRYRRWTIE